MKRCLLLFENSLKSDATREVYLKNLEYFARFHKIEDYDQLLKIEPTKLAEMIMLFDGIKVSN